jgi:glucose-6-phosphate isomerase
VAKHADHVLPDHQRLLLANAIAQAQALLTGKQDPGGHRHFTGNRPSSFFVLDRLSPKTLGALIALQEHRVFVSGSLWGINSFDQWGVELGKVLAKNVESRLLSGHVDGVDESTAQLISRLR